MPSANPARPRRTVTPNDPSPVDYAQVAAVVGHRRREARPCGDIARCRIVEVTVPPADSNEVTDLLRAWRSGDEHAGELLLEHAYRSLRNIAAAQMRGERAEHTLQPTALVHEAFLRLIGQRQVDWRDRAHFFGLAAVTMRRILVDHARRRLARKREAGEPETFTVAAGDGVDVGLLDLDRALTEFSRRFPRQAKLVELRYFSGLELEEIAHLLEVSPTTAKRDWRFARAWLREALASSP